MQFIDSHAHLSGTDFPEGIEPVLKRAIDTGIEAVVNICTDRDSLEKGLELSKTYPWIYNTVATTPHDVEQEDDTLFSLFASHAKKGDLVAVGETGLDYYYEHSPRDIQKKCLIRYLHLAIECKLPLVIHCRHAFKDFFELIDTEYHPKLNGLPGVLHCFTGTNEEAKELLDRGWFISMSGIATFKKSEELRDVARTIPLDQLLIETDTPYLAPQSKRGKTNEPSYLVETASVIASVKNLPLEAIADATTNNAKRLFKLL